VMHHAYGNKAHVLFISNISIVLKIIRQNQFVDIFRMILVIYMYVRAFGAPPTYS